jgi:hypothetical protein
MADMWTCDAEALLHQLLQGFRSDSWNLEKYVTFVQVILLWNVKQNGTCEKSQFDGSN